MAQWRNTLQSYGITAKSFHWLMALLVIGMLCVGFYMDGMEMGPDKIQLFGLHKSTGALILGLATLRLLWRWMNPVPALPAGIPFWQRAGAHLSHYGLYALLFAMPLIGWAMSSAAGFPVSVYGWFTLPNIVPVDPDMVKLCKRLHYYGAVAFIALISLHVLAALFHHFIRKDDVLRRMLP